MDELIKLWKNEWKYERMNDRMNNLMMSELLHNGTNVLMKKGMNEQ